MKIAYLVFGIVCITALIITPNALGTMADYSKNVILDQFQLKINQTASEPNHISVKFLNVTEDSRCPSGVTCIWQGESTVVVDITKNSQDLGNFNLKIGLGDKNATVQIPGGYFLQIITVDPYPINGTKIQLSDYLSTFTLSQAGVVSPLKQFKSGTSAQQVQCNTGLELVIKAENNSPACVSHSSASALMYRGWAIVNTTVSNNSS
ncbi:exported protein of unknown function [Nitrosotalea devaniterrae]|uniref:Uncharacterized protein n=1 Tax=Nitrosotalea devaniterrae TaxID=1078905 RepID=A0A128A497_9ARCH|nr:exported protein of unknown function [Candidatus Nitrosotalea devanaterra]